MLYRPARGPAPDHQTTAIRTALDLGTTTGWALLSREEMITSGTVSFRLSRYGGGMPGVRFRAWHERLAADAGPIGG